jgi:drug/metabolite transporter (DMT)-like permease
MAGLGAGMVWGLAVAVPRLVPTATPIALTFGRFFWYGVVATCVLFGGAAQSGLTARHWRKAAQLTLVGHIGYYTLAVAAIRLIGAASTAAVIGASPVAVALYGNWRRRERPFATLAAPAGLVSAGLACMLLPTAARTGAPLAQLLFGYGCAASALICWTWYSVTNAETLIGTAKIPPGIWAAALGVADLVWVVLIGIALAVVCLSPLGNYRALLAMGDRQQFLLATLLLGLATSAGGAWLWNQALARLSITRAGSLMASESLAGLVYIWLLDWRLPTLRECAAATLIIAGVAWSTLGQRSPARVYAVRVPVNRPCGLPGGSAQQPSE